MISKTKSLAFVFAFVALMVTLPLASNQNAFADGQSDLDLDCPVSAVATINFGDFGKTGVIGENTQTLTTGGSEKGTFQVAAGNWIGATAQKASTTITVLSPVAGNVLTINGITATAHATVDDGATFTIGANDAATAVLLAATINANGDTGTDVAGTDQFAIAVGNVVIVRSTVADAASNGVNVAQTTGTGTLVATDATLTDGENVGVIHMLSSATKYKITVDGSTSSSGTNYATKTAFDADGIVKNLAAETDGPGDKSVSLSTEISGIGTLINMQYKGDLTHTLAFTVTCNLT
jgi:hypothetical protein